MAQIAGGALMVAFEIHNLQETKPRIGHGDLRKHNKFHPGHSNFLARLHLGCTPHKKFCDPFVKGGTKQAKRALCVTRQTRPTNGRVVTHHRRRKAHPTHARTLMQTKIIHFSGIRVCWRVQEPKRFHNGRGSPRTRKNPAQHIRAALRCSLPIRLAPIPLLRRLLAPAAKHW